MNGITAVNGASGINTTGNVRRVEGWGANTLVKTDKVKKSHHDKSQTFQQQIDRTGGSKTSLPTNSFWNLMNAVEFPKPALNIQRTGRVEAKQFEQLLRMQSKIYQGGLVVEIVSKSADAVIHGVKRLQNTN